MFRSATNFEKLLDKATSNLLMEPDWPTILQICDLIRQNDCTPKNAVATIKKKLFSTNPHQAMFTLLVLESIVKNCGSGVHDEITTKINCDMFRELVKSSQHENVRTKMLELIQAWAFAFRNTPKYRTVQDTVNIMKAEGYKFPTLKESDAMFSADCAPEWSDGDVCHRCRVQFSLIQRKHHCRACGQVFCQQCSSKTTTLPKFGIEKDVRVCDACYDQITKPSAVPAPAKSDSEHSSDYGTTTHSTQPAQKTAEELQEEEELQLALALSQSEAEQKEKERQRSAPSVHINTSPAHVQAHGSPPGSAPPAELSRYLDRGYWEQRLQPGAVQESPSAPQPSPQPQQISISNDIMASKLASMKLENGASTDSDMEEFIAALKTQVEIFVNRMKSNSSRGRSIANDSSVQTLFMNITAMHSRLLRYIQQQDDSRVHYEALQDKLSQVKDSRAALDVLREEHAERMRRAAEQAERQRQMQMAHKLDIMRKKKQEYLQYQRQLALQRVQEQEREMQMRQEQQKHQYMMGTTTNPYYIQGSPVHQYQQGGAYPPPGGFPQGYMMPGMRPMGPMVMGQQMVMGPMPGMNVPPNQMPMPGGQPLPNQPNQMNQQGQPMPPHGQLPPHMQHQMAGGMPGQMPQQMGQPRPQIPPGAQVPPSSNPGQPVYQTMPPGQQIPQPGQGMPPQGQQMPPPGQGMPPQGQQMPQPGQPMPPQGQQMPPPGQGMPQQGQKMPPPGQGMPPQGQQMPQPGQGPTVPQQGQVMPPPGQGMPPDQSMQHMPQNQIPPQMAPNNQSPIPNMGQPGPDANKLSTMSPTSGIPPNQINVQAPPLGMTGQQMSQGSPQQIKPLVEENKTAELISFD